MGAMVRSLLPALFLAPLALFVACGGNGSGAPVSLLGGFDASVDSSLADSAVDAGGDDGSRESGPIGPTDAGDAGDTGGREGGLTTCAPGGPDRAVVIAVMGQSPEVLVLTQRGGTLVDRGLTFPLAAVPQYLAMRPDGQEALIAFGGYGSPFGVVTVTFAHDGSTAALGTPVTLNGDYNPWGMDYISNDRALLAIAGPTDSQIVTLDRSGAGFTETTRVLAPGAFPLKVLRRPGTDEAVMARCDFSTETATTFYVLGPADGGAYVNQGTTAQAAPSSIDFAVWPGGNLAYSPTSDPNNPITSSNLDAGGVLYVFGIGDGGVEAGSVPALPRVVSQVARDPLGQFLVMPGDVFMIDPQSGNPNVSTYVLLTVPLDANGQPMATLPETAQFPGLLFDDLQVSPTGHLVDALAYYDDGTRPQDMLNALEIRAQPAPGQWQVCQTLYETSASHIAIAP